MEECRRHCLRAEVSESNTACTTTGLDSLDVRMVCSQRSSSRLIATFSLDHPRVDHTRAPSFCTSSVTRRSQGGYYGPISRLRERFRRRRFRRSLRGAAPTRSLTRVLSRSLNSDCRTVARTRNQKISARRLRRRQFALMSGERSAGLVLSSETLKSRSDSSRDIRYGVRMYTLLFYLHSETDGVGRWTEQVTSCTRLRSLSLGFSNCMRTDSCTARTAKERARAKLSSNLEQVADYRVSSLPSRAQAT